MSSALNSDANRDCEEADPLADTEFDRQFPRHDSFSVAEALIYPLDGQSGEPIRSTVMVRDLSDRGFGITVDYPLHPRQRVVIDTTQKRLVGEVQWSRQLQPQVHIVGCRLLQS